jgi:hypothetical protein
VCVCVVFCVAKISQDACVIGARAVLNGPCTVESNSIVRNIIRIFVLLKCIKETLNKANKNNETLKTNNRFLLVL